MRPARDRWVDEHRPARRLGVRGQPPAGALGQPVVPRVCLVQCTQSELDGYRLAAGAASVRLQGVPEPAVGVAVGGDGVPDWKRPAASEYAFEMPPFEHARVGGQVLLSSVDVRFGHEVQHSTAPAAPS